MSDTYDRTLLSRFDISTVHRELCAVCRSGTPCLEQALRDVGRNDLNETDDEGYVIVPHFIRVREAEKLGLTYTTYKAIFTGGTVRFRYGSDTLKRRI